MNPGKGISVSLGAIVSAIASMACCLPLGAAAALGVAGAGIWFQRARPGLFVVSVLLLALGFWQQRRARRCGLGTGPLSVALLWIATAIVAAVFLFPQVLAGILANHLFAGVHP